ncbi:MAG: DEAD/DEAH box helicase family protein, partial [bacterium]|nr:DEAD/DEAH box helicase family protein [bacterium]
MAINDTREKRFESDIEAFLISEKGGYGKGDDIYSPEIGLYKNTFINFIKTTQPKAWKKFEFNYPNNTENKFIQKFNDEVEKDGILKVVKKGFKAYGIDFKVCYYMPESTLNEDDINRYKQNIWHCYRQWFYSNDNHKSVDMVLVLNGIPLFAFELKNQLTGQTIQNAEHQWCFDRDPKELCFRFNSRILAFFCIDTEQASMATKLNKEKTFFLPFNQGSNGAGVDSGAGNPINNEGYKTHYIWEEVFQRESMMDILQKFINLEVVEQKNKDGSKEIRKTLIFPRYHQLDVVRKLVKDVKQYGSGHNYLIQHSAGSGKSNSISWIAYRLATIFKENNEPLFKSVIIVTDRRVLDAQLQNTVAGMDHKKGFIETIDKDKNSQDLKTAINNGVRIIVTTLQKFPVIYEGIKDVNGKNFAIICDEAHSSQTGSAAAKLKKGLADNTEALRQYAELEEKAENEIDANDPLINEMLKHGKHKNLSYFAFTATPKPKTLEIFGIPDSEGKYHAFHIYSMRQAIEEGFIMDVLENYMTYKTSYAIANKTSENPDVKSSSAAKSIRKYAELHPYNISSKSEIIIETFRNITSKAING